MLSLQQEQSKTAMDMKLNVGKLKRNWKNYWKGYGWTSIFLAINFVLIIVYDIDSYIYPWVMMNLRFNPIINGKDIFGKDEAKCTALVKYNDFNNLKI